METLAPPEKILFVDDEVQILDSLRRELRGKFRMDMANSGQEALELLSMQGPYAVVVSDMRMPGMDGAELLARVRKSDPNTVRMMLTGYADVDSSIRAVNEGHIFRFMTKPVETQTLVRALVEGIRQFRLVRAERELLDKTLRGSIGVLTDIMSMVSPEAFGRASRIADYVRDMALALEVEEVWEHETAAMLSQIGCMTLPPDLVTKTYHGRSLSQKEAELFYQHPALAAQLLSHIPRLEGVSQIISFQEKHFNGQGPPEAELSQEQIPLGARLLKVALDFDTLVSTGHSKGKALEAMKNREGLYDPAVLTILDMILGTEARFDVRDVGVYDLEDNMILAQDIMMGEGRKLVGEGLRLSQAMIMRIRNFHRAVGIEEPIRVHIPLSKRL